LCEELNFVAKEKYTDAREILQPSKNIGEHYDLSRAACFQTEVTGMAWDAAENRCIVRSNRDDAIRAVFVVMSNGSLNKPKRPGLPEINDYRGDTFDTSRWG
jgi:cation diffusion facilitator CzcD-associated flavoprotein CzcO